MSIPPIPPTKSPVVLIPPKQNNTWLIIFRVVVVLFLAVILTLNILQISNNKTPPTPTVTPETIEGAPTQPPAITLNLIPPQVYQFSDEIALGINANQIQDPNDITAELLKSDEQSFETPRSLEIRDNKVIIPPSSFVGAFKVKVALFSDPSVNAITDVMIAEPNWALMSMTVKPDISFDGKTALVPGITHILLNDVPGNMIFTLGSDLTPHQQGEDITFTETFASADGSKLEMQFQGITAEDGNAFRYSLAQEVIVAKKADDTILSGTFNQYPVSADDKGQRQEKRILNNLPKCQDGLWSLGKDENKKEMGLVTGYVSLAQLPTFLTDKKPGDQSLFPKDIASAILRPTSDIADGCSFGKGAPESIVYKLDDEAVGKITFTQVLIPGYYKPAAQPAP